MKIKATLSWLKGAAVAAVVMGGGGGSAALAASPAPWEIEYSPEERRAGVDTELKNSKRNYNLSKDAQAAYEDLGNLPETLKNNEEVMFWRAWYASKAGLLGEAEEIYKDLILQNRENAWNYNALGYLLAKNNYGRLEEAVGLLEAAVAIEDENAAIIHSLGYAFHEMGRLEDAAENYTKAVKLLTDDQEGGADDETAQEIFESYGNVLLALPDKDAEFKILLNYLRQRRQDSPWSSAYDEVFFSQAFYKNRSSEEIVEHFSKLSENSSNSSRPVIIHALLLQRMGDQQGATILLKRAGNFIDEESSNDALDFYAFALYEAGMVAEAEERLRILITREPGNPWFYGRLGYLLAKEDGDIEEALELLQKALELAPGRPEFESFHAWALHKSGESVTAAEMADQAIRHELQMDVYSQVRALVEYGEILWSLGYKEEASDAWDEASETDSNHVDVIGLLNQHSLASSTLNYNRIILDHARDLAKEKSDKEAYEFLAVIDLVGQSSEIILRRQAHYAEKAGLTEAAQRVYNLLVEISPDNPYYYHKLGFLADDFNSYSDVRLLIEKALEQSVEDDSLKGTLSWLVYKQGYGSSEDAMNDLSKAIEVAGQASGYDRGGIYVSLLARHGEVLWARKLYSEAIEVWGKGLALDFEHDMRHEDLRQTLVRYAGHYDGMEIRRDQEKMANLNPGVLRLLKDAAGGL